MSPLAHAAAIAKRRQAENFENVTPRHRIKPLVEKKFTDSGRLVPA